MHESCRSGAVNLVQPCWNDGIMKYTGETGAMGDTANVKVELDTLKTFRDRVDTLLESLDGSAASPTQISHQTLEAQHLGSVVANGFTEVNDLTAMYKSVQGQLQDLSKTLSDQINAMSITIQVSQVGYQNVEADQVDALWAIQTRTQKQVAPPGQDGLTVQQQQQAAAKDKATGGHKGPGTSHAQ